MGGDTEALERAYVRVVMACTTRPEMRGYAAAMIAKLADVLEDPKAMPPGACVLVCLMNGRVWREGGRRPIPEACPHGVRAFSPTHPAPSGMPRRCDADAPLLLLWGVRCDCCCVEAVVSGSCTDARDARYTQRRRAARRTRRTCRCPPTAP